MQLFGVRGVRFAIVLSCNPLKDGGRPSADCYLSKRRKRWNAIRKQFADTQLTNYENYELRKQDPDPYGTYFTTGKTRAVSVFFQVT